MAPKPKVKPEPTLNLVGKLAKIMQGIEPMHKSESTGSGSYGYKFISVNAMIDIARPILADAGIIFYGDVEGMERFDKLGKNANQTFIYLTVRWHVRDGDEEFHFTTVGEASDTGDKAANKAMTAAQKQAISKLLMMSGTDDDPDREVSPVDTPSNRVVARDPVPDAPPKRQPAAPKNPNTQKAMKLLHELAPDNSMWPAVIKDVAPDFAGIPSKDLSEDDWDVIAMALEPRVPSGEPTEVSQNELPEGWSDST